VNYLISVWEDLFFLFGFCLSDGDVGNVPLKLDFKAGDKLVINGAVMENIGSNARFLIHNESAILREKEVLSEADTATPAARVYFALQCAYIFPHEKEKYIEIFRDLLGDYLTACPSAAPIGDEIEGHISDGKLYKGLKSTHKLIDHERNLLESIEHSVEDATKALEAPDGADPEAAEPEAADTDG